MPHPLIPSYVFDTIYEITPALMHKNGVRGILIDLDGTMASSHDKNPPETLRPFLHSFLDQGIAVLVLSNNNSARVRIFCEGLDVPFLHRALKPALTGFIRGAKALKLPLSACAVVGDQIYTDTLGGNRAGAAATFYVRSIDRNRRFNRLRYKLERRFIEHGRREMHERGE